MNWVVIGLGIYFVIGVVLIVYMDHLLKKPKFKAIKEMADEMKFHHWVISNLTFLLFWLPLTLIVLPMMLANKRNK